MAGRPKKKPEYNPELQFNNFLQELRDAYEEADSLRSLADELNISLLKLLFSCESNHLVPKTEDSLAPLCVRIVVSDRLRTNASIAVLCFLFYSILEHFKYQI